MLGYGSFAHFCHNVRTYAENPPRWFWEQGAAYDVRMDDIRRSGEEVCGEVRYRASLFLELGCALRNAFSREEE